MPEGPEVKTFFDSIKFIKHKILEQIIQLDNNPRYHIQNIQLPTRIVDCGVKGKTIWWKLEEHSILFTHGMTGHWVVPNKRSYYNSDPKYNRLEFIINGKSIYFNDVRKFAHVKVVTNLETELLKLGPSVLDKPSYEEFYERFKNKKTEIAKLLLQQDIISGIGNYLRAEILWKSRISPLRTYTSLTEEDKKILYRNALEVTQYHYDHPEDFNFNVYEQERDPFGNPVSKTNLNNRSIYWVKKIQL
jgi:DNA-formamidopyrimidine glycosylase